MRLLWITAGLAPNHFGFPAPRIGNSGDSALFEARTLYCKRLLACFATLSDSNVSRINRFRSYDRSPWFGGGRSRIPARLDLARAGVDLILVDPLEIHAPQRLALRPRGGLNLRVPDSIDHSAPSSSRSPTFSNPSGASSMSITTHSLGRSQTSLTHVYPYSTQSGSGSSSVSISSAHLALHRDLLLERCHGRSCPRSCNGSRRRRANSVPASCQLCVAWARRLLALCVGARGAAGGCPALLCIPFVG